MNFSREDNESLNEILTEFSMTNKSMSSTENTAHPIWWRINKGIEDVFQFGGRARLGLLEPRDGFVYKLSMASLAGKYRLIAFTNAPDPRDELYEWWEPGNTHFRGKVYFEEDEWDWDARTVCTDLAVAKAMFRELFDYGDLREGIKQMRSSWDRKPR